MRTVPTSKWVSNSDTTNNRGGLVNSKEWTVVTKSNHKATLNKQERSENTVVRVRKSVKFKYTTSEQNIMTPNPFTPLSNLKGNGDPSKPQEQNQETSTQNKNQQKTGTKTPMIINGTITNSEDRNPIVKKKKRTHLLGSSRNNKEHKVKIIGDSHFREIAARIDQYLNTKFEVNSWVKPGATTEEITATLEKDLSCLGKTDVIAINGGANDTESKGNRINRVLVNMLKFMQKYATTNIIIVNIPHRYDKNWNSVTNSDIQACNRKLNKIVERFSHVTVVGVDSIRKHFTQQGMHLNKKDKEWISRLIATQINKLTTGKNGDTHEITLNWKDELPNKQTIVQVQSEPVRNSTNQQQ